MAFNTNHWVLDLLSWHGQGRGGVRVPFSTSGGNPLRDLRGEPETLETPLILRLRALAKTLASGGESPRWIFLIGGPGNGKSEAVQDFILALDHEAKCGGALVGTVTEAFGQRPLPWVINVRTASLFPTSASPGFEQLVVIQDASASADPTQDAAVVLATELRNLMAGPPSALICCINRGLLARALAVAHRMWPSDISLLDLLRSLITATALGSDALSDPQPSCWPLSLPERHVLTGEIACWPLDIESLLLAAPEAESPFVQIVKHAVEGSKWELAGMCLDCDARDLCPFRQNAEWLRSESQRGPLSAILRGTELATSQRWNFRDAFSLVAEMLVGQPGDPENSVHPCRWVHSLVEQCRRADTTPDEAALAALQLTFRSYPQALFAGGVELSLSQKARDLASQDGCDITLSVERQISTSDHRFATHIGDFVRYVVSPRLDPAGYSPHDTAEPLAVLEDAYSQSVLQGNTHWPVEAPMAPIETLLFGLLTRAENEWDPLSRESALVTASVHYIRGLASCIAKRSVGTRLGLQSFYPRLTAYQESIRNAPALERVTEALRSLLGRDGHFRFNSVESFGQPQSESDWPVTLEGATVRIRHITPAPSPSEERPAHDLPTIRVADHLLPLTFDLYASLELRRRGCTASSLQASLRAGIDRIRHLYAGRLCRDIGAFADGDSKFEVGSGAEISVSGSTPVLRILTDAD